MLNNNLSVKPIQNSDAISYKVNPVHLSKLTNTKYKFPKIVGDIRHYPPANKEWKNSMYAFNKNSLRSLPALDKMAAKTIKSYFSLTNDKKLARSERMRNLIRRKTVKRLFVSKPEIKQTNDKVNITVYTFNRERQFFLRKMYFYNKNMFINKNIYLHKLWLKKNMLAFKEIFRNRRSVKLIGSSKKKKIKNKIRTQRKYINKTYIHSALLKKYFLTMKTKNKANLSSDQNRNKIVRQTRFSRKLLELRILRLLTKKNLPQIDPLIKNNLLKSLKKRNLIRLLKKRENKKINSASSAIHVISKKMTSKKRSLLMPNYSIKRAFKNYLKNKISRKIVFKLRNFNSVVKIEQKRKKSKRFRFKKIRLPYSNLKFKNEIKFFSFKLVSELKFIRKLFQFHFIKYLFSALQIRLYPSNMNVKSQDQKVNLYIGNIWTNRTTPAKFSRTRTLLQSTESNSSNNLNNPSNNSKNLLDFLKPEVKKNDEKNKSKNSSKKEGKIIQFKNKYSYDKLRNIDFLNFKLLSYLKTILNTLKNNATNKETSFSLNTIELRKNPIYTMILNKENVDLLFKKFERKYFLMFLAKFFKKEFLYLNYYSKFLINQLKFGKFLPGLKLLISKIYAKKVELNIVNLKYSHLNTDIYTESIATKLSRKTSLLRVMKWALNLARLPYEYLPSNNVANLNKLQSLIIHKSLDVNDLNPVVGTHSPVQTNKNSNKLNSFDDRLHGILGKLYPHSLVHALNLGYNQINPQINVSKNTDIQSISSKKKVDTINLNLSSKKGKPAAIAAKPIWIKNLNVLNIIKYKWVSGVRLEAAGRLTRRYTAARSVFKYRYKGNLKNIDHSQKTDPSKKNVSTVMLRNHMKSNSQYSFAKSKKRIGAFGIKAWIGSY